MLANLYWNELSEAERESALARAAVTCDASLAATVRELLAEIRAHGEAKVLELGERFDKVRVDSLAVLAAEFDAAPSALDDELRAAIDASIERLTEFHEACKPAVVRVTTAEGVRCMRIPRAIERVGLYVPGGAAPLLSTMMMLGVPARIAGCQEVTVCTPPQKDGGVHPAILYIARRLGITRVLRCGGVQAIGALAHGVGGPAVHKIFGPGNAWVTEAKRQIAANTTIAIDMPAGPSEVLVIADADANPDWVAMDLLAQSEHGVDSQSILVTDSQALAERVGSALSSHLSNLPRASTAHAALTDQGRALVVDDIDTAFAVSNRYAPEHLILHLDDAEARLAQIQAAGSVFLGPWAPESVGDYTSGTNHVLPTYGSAAAVSGVNVDSFMVFITAQALDRKGLEAIGPAAEILAEAEGLHAHGRAVSLRLEGGSQ